MDFYGEGLFMRRFSRAFWMILAAGLLVRLAAAALAPHPGIGDPNHYYNLAHSLAEGRGFVIDYIWQYHLPPDSLTHPTDYWMPLPGVWPALSIQFLGDTLFAALLPSVIFGALLPVLAYGIAAAADTDESTRLMSMAGVVFLPEFVLNSARTDTTISYVLFFGLCALCFTIGIRRRPPLLFLAGIFAGLAHLSRQDSIILLPAFALAILLYWRLKVPLPWRWLPLIAVGWLLAILPWLLRNLDLFGVILPGGAARTPFMTSFIDQFTYGRELNLQHYLDWGLPNILSNWVVQALANVRMTFSLLDVLLPVTALAGLVGMIWKRDRDRALILILPLCMILGLFLFYSFVTPFHTQGGSFKKSVMLAIPFLAFAGAWALRLFVQPRWAAYFMAGLMALLMLSNALDLVRQDFDLARRYEASFAGFIPHIDAAGDQNGDGEIVIMGQDPFMLNKIGYRALMIPSDPREMILAAAYRYGADFIMLPTARAALQALENGRETDPRLRYVGEWDGFGLLAITPAQD